MPITMKTILLFFPSRYHYGKVLVNEEKLPLKRVFKRQCRLELDQRYVAHFSTSSHTSRICAYDDNVLNGSGSGVYSGKGIRIFINARYRPAKEMDIWARYIILVYRQTRTIGSGLNEIARNKKVEIKLQLRHQF